MKKIVGYFLAAAGGALFGGLATKLHMSKKHNQELRAVREELRASYAEQLATKTELATNEANEALEAVKQELDEVRQHHNTSNANYQEAREIVNKLPDVPMTKKQRELQEARAFVIRPDEYGTRYNYARLHYIFFPEQGKYMNSDYQTPVSKEEINDVLGDVRPEDHFGEFEDGQVYVRNEDLKVDVAVYLAQEGHEAYDDEDEEE